MSCLMFGFLLSYIFVRWINLLLFMGGVKAGAFIGLKMGLIYNFFVWSDKPVVDCEKFMVNMSIAVILSTVVATAHYHAKVLKLSKMKLLFSGEFFYA